MSDTSLIKSTQASADSESVDKMNADVVELPTSEAELWRYSRIDDFSPSKFKAANRPTEFVIPASSTELLEVLGVSPSHVLLTADGFIETLPEVPGISVSVKSGNAHALVDGAEAFCNAFDGSQADALEVHVTRKFDASRPLVIAHVVTQDGVAAFPTVNIKVDDNARVSVLEVVFSAADDVVGPEGIASVVVPQTRVEVGAGANADYVNLQLLNNLAWQFGFQTSLVGRDALLRSTSIALGGYYARVETEGHLVGKGGEAHLNALYFGTGDQMHDFRTLQAHDAPKTTSDLLFKGAVANSARSVYSGLIRVTKGAAGTKAFQTNRNLVLSDGAHADSVPNLEIDEPDVSCSHASAIGPVDEEQVYYLESRGVLADVARRLIVLGFLGELTERSGLQGLRSFVDSRLAQKLADANLESVAR